MNQAVFLDRDGILNKVLIRENKVASPRSPQELEVLPEAIELVKTIKTKGYVPIVVTNQPDVGRGLITQSQLDAIHSRLQDILNLDAFEVCTSGNDSDPRRKPNPGMILEAREKFNIDLHSSYLIGDGEKDILAGKKAGVPTVLLQTGYNTNIHGLADYNCSSLREIIQLISSPFSYTYLNQTKTIIDRLDTSKIETTIKFLCATREAKGRLFLLGSGGGAGHASHAACDFRKLCNIEAYCPTDNVSELTARINDDGWETSYVGYLKGSHLSHNDCVMIFSVGGGSVEKNISLNLVYAANYAKHVGAKLIGIVGRDGGETAKLSDVSIIIPTADQALITAHTESFQALVWHLLVSHPDLKENPTKW